MESSSAADRASRLKRAWARLRGGELTPSRAFWSVAIGIFVGVQPTPGLHLPVVLAICLPLRLDAPVSYVAANISIPPVAPFLWFTSIQIGSWLVQGHFAPLTPEGARDLIHAPGPLLLSLALGSIALGAALGVVGGSIAYGVTRARRKPVEPTAFEEAARRTVARYARASAGRGVVHYVRGKLFGDPVVRAIAELAPLGDVLDVGCGRGQLALLLLELDAATSVAAIDWDERKVRIATLAGDGARATFASADVRDAELPDADTVLLIDVLHYLSREEQDALIARAAERVRPGGRLIVRDASAGYGWRSFLTSIVERISTGARFNRGERVLLRDLERELAPLLAARDFSSTVEPCWRGTPFANVLLVASSRKAARDATLRA